MIKPHSTTSSGLAFICLCMLAGSCRKTVSHAGVSLQVSGISPMEGPGGTTVTISGVGFSAVPGADSVSFNGKPAKVIFAEDSILQVTVPALAGNGDISVKVGGATLTVAEPYFIYDYRGVASTYAGTAGVSGSKNGPRTSSLFSSPWGIAADDSGNLYIADFDSSLVRQITPDGTVSTLLVTAGQPSGVALDGNGHLYVSVLNTFPQILQVNLATGHSTVLSGSGVRGFNNSTNPSKVQFNEPTGLAVDRQGNVYVAESGTQLIRVIRPNGATSTFAGVYPVMGAQNGAGSTATFNRPVDFAFDVSGNGYVADADNNLIRKITPDTVVTRFTGDGNYGFADGVGSAAGFGYPAAITADNKGNLFVADEFNDLIRMITPIGIVSTIAGNGNVGSTDGLGAAATFNGPQGIAWDGKGNLFVADGANCTIRKITLQ